MRAGKLDRIIQIQEYTRTGTTPGGAPILGWADFITVRAQLLQASTEEYLRGYGETEAKVVIFRIRWLDGLTVKHRVHYESKLLEIKEIKEIGRRNGLEVRCDEVRT